MKQQLLLLEDVDGLGRAGELVTAKPGFIRNYLLPQKKGLIADKQTLKMQARLQEEREKRAAVDRKASEELAAKFAELVLSTEVKIDPDGKMYGSVTTLEIANLLQEKGYEVERKQVMLAHPIKNLGTHSIQLRLKENVPASFTLEVTPEGGPLPVKEKEEELEAAVAEEETAQ